MFLPSKVRISFGVRTASPRLPFPSCRSSPENIEIALAAPVALGVDRSPLCSTCPPVSRWVRGSSRADVAIRGWCVSARSRPIPRFCVIRRSPRRLRLRERVTGASVRDLAGPMSSGCPEPIVRQARCVSIPRPSSVLRPRGVGCGPLIIRPHAAGSLLPVGPAAPAPRDHSPGPRSDQGSPAPSAAFAGDRVTGSFPHPAMSRGWVDLRGVRSVRSLLSRATCVGASRRHSVFDGSRARDERLRTSVP